MSELFIEIGCEELPARFVVSTMEGFAASMTKLLGPLTTTAPRAWATPRRIAVAFGDVQAETPRVEKLVTGPPVAAAFEDGVPGPAALAFAAKMGVSVDALQRVAGPKGEVVAALRMEGGECLVDLVAAGLEAAILGIPFRKTMRWGKRREQFPRPIQYVCAVLDGALVPASVCGQPTVASSVGHWLWFPEPFAVVSAAQWEQTLLERDVVADVATRRARLVRLLGERSADLGAELNLDEALVDEVTNLVEKPTVIVGEFDAALLSLPPRLLVESMKVNQRYFPLYRDGALTNQFLVATNNPHGDAALIARGNARVLAARFHDAKFFFGEDAKKPLVEHGKRLSGMLWLREVKGADGRALTMLQRQAIVAEAGVGLAGLCGADADRTRQAGLLCKSDLPTLMVGEFPELQGHVGRKLLEDVEHINARVALAVEEHYHPRFAGDSIPTSAEGSALSLAERLTLLDAAFAAGHAPKGGGDALALRRAAGGVVAVVLGGMGTLSSASVPELFSAAGVAGSEELTEFVLARLKALLGGEGVPTDVVEAVAATGSTGIGDIAARARAFGQLAEGGQMAAIRVTFRRVAGLVKQNPGEGGPLQELDAAALEAVGRALRDAVVAIPASGRVDERLASLVGLRPLVDAYFDGVMVMAEEPTLRAARLGLLRGIVARFSTLADFSRLSTG